MKQTFLFVNYQEYQALEEINEDCGCNLELNDLEIIGE